MKQLFFTILIISLTSITIAQTVEINKKQKMYTLEKIEYRTTKCSGTCPQFKIVIDKSKNASFEAQQHNRKDKNTKEIKGKYTTTLKHKEFDEIFNLLNELDFPNFKDKYNSGRKDYPSCFLTIIYDNGKRKKISDYGQNGSPELKKIYNLMFELRFNQEWEKNEVE